MHIEKLYIENYKIFTEIEINLNADHNVFVGNNDSGKSTILEALEIVLSGNLNRMSFTRQLKMSHFNLQSRATYLESLQQENYTSPPSIIIEAYFNDDENLADLKGTNNTLGHDCPGIRFEVSFDSNFSELYKKMLDNNEVRDIPVEIYNISWYSFKGEPILFRKLSSLRVTKIDTTKKDYSNAINRFINSAITDNLSTNDRINLSKVYKHMRQTFNDDDTIKELNKLLETNGHLLDGKTAALGLKDETIESWIDSISVDIEGVPFENLGFGTQNLMKMELNYNREEDISSFVLFEEPENNLSFSNMNKLVTRLKNGENKQLFVSTHSSFIANKLNLCNLFIIENGVCLSLNHLSQETQSFFKKLPGYDTVRILLSKNPILVEGPTDELILQRAYKDIHGKLPIENGIDILVVDSLAFKRYCELANLIDKKIKIVTDNDGDINKNIIKKYTEYNGNENVKIYYEYNELLNTLEPSVLEINSSTQEEFDRFKNIIGKENSLKNRNKESVLKFMKNNKTLWGLRVFDSEESINYPKYIHEIFE